MHDKILWHMWLSIPNTMICHALRCVAASALKIDPWTLISTVKSPEKVSDENRRQMKSQSVSSLRATFIDWPYPDCTAVLKIHSPDRVLLRVPRQILIISLPASKAPVIEHQEASQQCAWKYDWYVIFLIYRIRGQTVITSCTFATAGARNKNMFINTKVC